MNAPRQSIHFSIRVASWAFLALYFFLAYHNRLAADDFYYLYNAETLGIWGSVVYEYNTWATGFAAHLVNHSVLKWAGQGQGLIAFHAISLLLFYQAVSFFTKGFFKRFYPNHDKETERSIVLLLVTGLFISTIGIGETWYWLVAACVYLWSLIAAISIAGVLLHPEKKPWHLVLLAFSALYIGGSQPALALGCMGGLALLLALAGLKKVPQNIALPALVGLLVLSGAFAAYNLGLGRTIRASVLHPLPWGEAVVLNIKMTGIFLLKKLPFKALLMLPFWIAFNEIKQGGKFTPNIQIRPKQMALIALVWFAGVYIYLLPATQLLNDIAPDRALGPLTFSLFFLGCFFSWSFPKKESPTSLQWNRIGWVLPVVFIGFFLTQIFVLPKYSEAYDKRMDQLENTRTEDPVLIVDSLPNSGMLFSAEINTDTNHFTNEHLKKGLQLPFAVKVQK